MNKFNDIRLDLDEDIDIKSSYNLKKIDSWKISWKSLNDISKISNNSTLNIKKKNQIFINKKSTDNFDSFYSWNNSSLNIKDPKKDYKYFINKIRLFFKKYYLLLKLRKKKNKFLKKKQKKVLLFLFFIFVIFFANKLLVENLISYWYSKIIKIYEGGSIDQISLNWSKSNISLKVANILLQPFSVIPNDNINNALYVIKWWERLSSMIVDSTKLYYSFEELKNKKSINEINIVDFLKWIKHDFISMNNKIYSALFYYSFVWDLWDDNLNNKLALGESMLFDFYNKTSIVQKNYDTLLSIFWNNTTRRYLVVFQNNDEIRPTGWFMWSTATITIKNWEIIDIENSDIYAHEWNINKVYNDKIKAPEWLNQITWTFWLRDANYFPEFKQSSNTIKSFLDKIDYNIDWIIYINQNVILDLLENIWNVKSEVLWMNINDKNFSLVISTLVEAKVFKVWTLWTPKQILFDFAWELYKTLKEEWNYYDYFKIVSNHIKNRDIVFYSFRSEENSLLWKLGINWDVNYKDNFDFNYPVFTSIWWNKTDRYIDYNIKKVVQSIPDSCDFVSTLKISKTHNFTDFDDSKVNTLLNQYWIKDKTDILNIQWRWDNKSYLRIIVPKNTEVYLQDWQTLDKKNEYNIIWLYTYVRKMETWTNEISYRLKNPDCKEYNYKYYKQPWIKNYNIEFDVLWNYNQYKWINSDFIYKN